MEKDRDGCPKIVNLGASRTDLFYERRRLGNDFTTLGYLVKLFKKKIFFQVSRKDSQQSQPLAHVVNNPQSKDCPFHSRRQIYRMWDNGWTLRRIIDIADLPIIAASASRLILTYFIWTYLKRAMSTLKATNSAVSWA